MITWTMHYHICRRQRVAHRLPRSGIRENPFLEPKTINSITPDYQDGSLSNLVYSAYDNTLSTHYQLQSQSQYQLFAKQIKA